ncbi:MAG: protein kinase [Roseburia sp.]
MTKVGMVLDGKYEILKEIGQGGMSIVYVAMDNRLNKQWAIKELKNDGTQSVEMLLKGIEREANILKKVDHPVLPRIVDIIDKDGTVYVVMDYIQGLALDKILKQEGAQPQDKVIEWAKQLASALDYLHSMNPPIIYRDMKPSNVMLQPDGRVKLIDFGTAKEYKVDNIADTTALGTRGYAAPEQFGDAQGRGIYKTDARTDVYCLGATLYHIVTGMNPSEPPYEMRPIREWNPSLSSGLEAIILKCTQPNPQDRYQSCSELIYALEHYHELDSGFRKKQSRKLFAWGVSLALMAVSLVIARVGYVGLVSERNQSYQQMISQAENAKLSEDYVTALAAYDQAITQIDSTKNDAYMDMLTLYKTYGATDESETLRLTDGLERLAGYMSNGYLNVDKNSEVIQAIAMTYFEEKDYKSSLTYFNQLDQEDYPEAAYCITIASALSELNATSTIDEQELLNNMEAFESCVDQNLFYDSNDAAATYINKIDYYLILADIYITYSDDIEGAAEKSVEVSEKAYELLDDIEDEERLVYYNVKVDEMLVRAYTLLASNQSGNEQRASYEMALTYAEDILSIVSSSDDEQKRCDTMYDMAQIYEKLGDNQKAIEQYERAIKEFGTKYKKIYIGYLSLLCSIEESKTTNIADWDAGTILPVYDAGQQIQDIDNDIRWKKLTQKLEPLFEKNGR